MIDKIKEFFREHREIIMYLIFGVSTTLVSWGSYALFVETAGLSVKLGNTLSWVCAVLFAFVTNKLWVFNSKSWSLKDVFNELVAFISSRLLTGAIEIAGVPLLIDLGLSQAILGIDGMLAKVLISVIIVILNYVFSKLIVFREKSK